MQCWICPGIVFFLPFFHCQGKTGPPLEVFPPFFLQNVSFDTIIAGFYGFVNSLPAFFGKKAQTGQLFRTCIEIEEKMSEIFTKNWNLAIYNSARVVYNRYKDAKRRTI